MGIKLTGLAVAVALATLATPALSQEKEGNWMVRVRAVNLDMDNKSDPGTGAGGVTAAVLPADSIKASSKTIPEVDITYFFTKNLAAELILTIPQTHSVSISQGALQQANLGGFKELPPTLLAQYHFLPDGDFRPYVGVGLNYTKISGVGLNSTIGGPLGLESSSTGMAYQAGFDYKIGKNMFLNFDVKKIFIQTDVITKNNGQKISELHLDPLAVGVGIGWHF
jgi:outer membrane protein